MRPRNTLTAEERATLTPEQKQARLEEIRDAPCPASFHRTHGDPDNSGSCIYCGCSIDIDEDLDY